MSSPSSSGGPLSYTPYTRKTHSRGPSNASIGSVQDAIGAGSASISNGSAAAGPSSSSTPLRFPQAQANGHAAPAVKPAAGLRIIRPANGSLGRSSGGAISSDPPPLRRISEIRKAAGGNSSASPGSSTAQTSPRSDPQSQNGSLQTLSPAANSGPSSSKLQLSPNSGAAAQRAVAAGSSNGGSTVSASSSRSASPPSITTPTGSMRAKRASYRSSGSTTPFPLSLPPANLNAHPATSSLYTSLVNDPIPIPAGPALANAGAARGLNGAGPNGAYPSDGTAAARTNGSGYETGAQGRQTPYRPGFQARGVYRVLTDEFDAARRRVRGSQDRRRTELAEERLTRRLEKLLAVHDGAAEAVRAEALAKKESRAASSSIDSGLGEFGDTGEKDLASSVRGVWSTLRSRASQLAASLEDPEKVYVRAKEQEIVHWEDDRSAKKCPICSTPFSLAVRKHHCRLCGRVVCASPQLTRFGPMESAAAAGAAGAAEADREAQSQKCSGLVLADPRSTRISPFFVNSEPGGDGLPADGGASEKGKSADAHKDLLRIRLCRECRDTVCRRQYMLEDGTAVPTYLKLYEALMRLQREIEESLPEFQEMVLGLQKQDSNATLGFEEAELSAVSGADPTQSPSKQQQHNARMMLALQKDAATARKQLLANFANYDALARRIRSLPPEDPGPLASPSSVSDQAQERLQQAVWTRANLFLQQNMFPLQTLPKLQGKKDGAASPTSSAASTPPLGGAAAMPAGDAALQQQLAVLLEQEELVASYVESANRARKFDDAKSLRKSLDDLRREIAQIRRQLGIPQPAAAAPAKKPPGRR